MNNTDTSYTIADLVDRFVCGARARSSRRRDSRNAVREASSSAVLPHRWHQLSNVSVRLVCWQLTQLKVSDTCKACSMFMCVCDIKRVVVIITVLQKNTCITDVCTTFSRMR